MMNFEQHFLKLHLYNSLIGQKTFQFSPKDSVSDLRNTLCETTELAIYQNFHFEYDGKVLSEFIQMGQLLTSGARINIIFDPFDQRSSKFHYTKTKNLLENPSILINQNYSYDQNADKKQTDNNKIKLAEDIDAFMKAIQKQQLMQYQFQQFQHKFSERLHFSGYNPVPYYRKLMGDYYYIYFKSPEQVDHHITGHSEGFFLNQSTNSHFNANVSPKNPKTSISLLDLLYQISPKFKQVFKETLNKMRNNKCEKFTTGLITSKKFQWMRGKKQLLNKKNTWKINPGQRAAQRQQIMTIKDWNQMFQIQHLEPSGSLYQKINREKLKFKIYQQFVEHAKLGAINIVDKMVLPINPNCARKQQTFLFTNIYFSFVDNSFEQKDYIQLLRNNGAQLQRFNRKDTKLTNNYILNLQVIDNLQGLGIHLSHSVLVQYKGQKIRAQSFPSSLIHTKAKHQLIQATIDGKNCINSHLAYSQNISNSVDIEKVKDVNNINASLNRDFNQSLIKLTFKLHLQYDNVVKLLQDQNQTVKKIAVSTEIKGVKTIDKSKYLFNLHALMAKDFNFIQPNETKGNLIIPQGNDQDYDYLVLRPQLISLYNQKFRCRIPINPMLGKTLQGKYQVIMNEKLRTEQKKLRAMASFAKENVVNMLITAFEGEMKKYLADTRNIIDIMHKYGLNCRYLGFLYKKIDRKKSPHLQILIEKAIYIKCVKNIINTALKAVPTNKCRYLVSHLFNCIFYPHKVTNQEYNVWKSTRQEEQEQQSHELLRKKKKKNKGKQKQKEQSPLTLNSQENGQSFLSIKPQDFNELIKNIAKIKYNHTFDLQQALIVEPKMFKYLYGKYSVLRDICLNTGIVLEKRDYFSDKSATLSHPFLYEHVCAFNARCTHINPDKKQLEQLIYEGDQFLSQFLVEQSIQSYNKAIQYILTTFGGNNQKLPLLHKKSSFIYFKIGDIQSALLFGSHSLGMFEEFYGSQHVQTIDNLALLGIYHCAQRNFSEAEQCLFKALYYAYSAYGQVYPQILTLWLNLSTIYQIQKQYAQAIMCIFEGLKTCIKVFTQNHLNTAIYFAALSSLHFQIPDIMSAIKYKGRSLNILLKLLPHNDIRVKESNQMLDYLKYIQSSKKIKQIHQKQLRKLQTSTFGYHPPQTGGWEFNGRNSRGNPPGANMLGFGNRNLAKMQEYFLRQREQYWRKNAGRRSR